MTKNKFNLTSCNLISELNISKALRRVRWVVKRSDCH